MAEGIMRGYYGPYWAVLSMQDDGPQWIVGEYVPKGREASAPYAQKQMAEDACRMLNGCRSGFDAFVKKWNANKNNPVRPVEVEGK